MLRGACRADIAYVMEQTFVSSRFGEVSFEEADVIEFPWGIPGFDSLRHFLALSGPGNPDVVWLQSLEDPAVALPTGDPWRFFPNYDPLLPAYAVVGLDLSDPPEAEGYREKVKAFLHQHLAVIDYPQAKLLLNDRAKELRSA